MGWFASGILLGVLFCAGLSAVAWYYASRRFARLQARTARAERLAELGTLTGGLAHEIKNPLSTVHLNLQLLQEDLSPENPAYARIINRLKIVQRETLRLKDTLDDFLRYAGKLELDRRPIEINELLEELADFYAPQAQLQRVQLRLVRSEQPLTANVDPKLIKQAILNLLINALQAVGDRGGEIILAARRDEGFAVINVIDTGGGMAAEALPHIFQAYYSTKKGGTGLGLAMTHRIVAEHGGTLDAKSEVGKGTDFTLRLPL